MQVRRDDPRPSLLWPSVRCALLRGVCVAGSAGALGGLLGLASGLRGALLAGAAVAVVAGGAAAASALVEAWAVRTPRPLLAVFALAWLGAALAAVAGVLQTTYAVSALRAASPDAGVNAVARMLHQVARSPEKLLVLAVACAFWTLPLAATAWARARGAGAGEGCGCSLGVGLAWATVLTALFQGLRWGEALVLALLFLGALGATALVAAWSVWLADRWERALIARRDPACAALLATQPAATRLWLLAYLGQPPARRLLGARAPAAEPALDRWCRHLWRASTPALARAAAAVARLRCDALADPALRERTLEFLAGVARPRRGAGSRGLEAVAGAEQRARDGLAELGPEAPVALRATVDWTFSPDASQDPIAPDGPYRRRVARATRLAELATEAAVGLGEPAVRQAIEAELSAWVRGEAPADAS